MTRHLPQILHHLDQLGRALRTARRASEGVNGRWLITDLPEVVAYAKAANAARIAIVNHIGRLGATIGEEWGFGENEK
jgi:hypothetical protein